MKTFVTLVAALPMAAAALPMFVSIRAALASRYSYSAGAQTAPDRRKYGGKY
jgi:hypothetical protein